MTPAGTSNELDVQNGWEENTHTLLKIFCPPLIFELFIKITISVSNIYSDLMFIFNFQFDLNNAIYLTTQHFAGTFNMPTLYQ